MNARELAIVIAREDSELEVKRILEDEGIWDDISRWVPLGGRENNFGVIGNQQPNSDAALVEKITNSLDALTMRACKAACIDPEDPYLAPSSPAEASERFFDIPDGNLCMAEKKDLDELVKGRGIVVAFTGDDKSHKKAPSVIVYDKGEGQSPHTMPDTVLSTNASNKLRVPFVQGRFNMGGTGILPFCGKLGMQLLIARKAPDIPDDGTDPTVDDWGFTLVRKFTPDECPGTKQSHYRYLVDGDGKVMALGNDALPIFPQYKPKTGMLNYIDVDFGMFVKMYEIQELPRVSANARGFLRNRLNTLLPGICHPVSVQECRKAVLSKNIKSDIGPTAPIYGLLYILNTRIENEEIKLVDSAVLSVRNATLLLNAYVYDDHMLLKRDLGDLPGDREGVLFIEGGQTQGSIRKHRFSTNAIGLSFLERHLLVTVDCTDIRPALREELFMPSRDRLREGSAFSKEVVSAVENALHDSAPLNAEAQRRRDLEMSKGIENDLKQQENMVRELMKFSGLRAYLSGQPVSIPMKSGKVSSGKFKGLKHPTFFKLVGKPPIAARIGGKLRIRFSTDAENAFFTRSRKPGKYSLERDDAACPETYRMVLRDGTATLVVDLPEDATVGDSIRYRLTVFDRGMGREFIRDIPVIVREEKKGREHSDNEIDGKKKRGKSSGKGKSLKGLAGTMPRLIEVHEENWPDYEGMNKDVAILIRGTMQEGLVFYVNMDYAPLIGQLNSSAKRSPNAIEAMKIRFKNGVFAAGWEATAKSQSRGDEEYTKHAQDAVNDTAASILFTSEGAGYSKAG